MFGQKDFGDSWALPAVSMLLINPFHSQVLSTGCFGLGEAASSTPLPPVANEPHEHMYDASEYVRASPTLGAIKDSLYK